MIAPRLRFLTVRRVVLIHENLIVKHGGETGILNPGLLESAVAMPKAGFNGEYLHTDKFAMAAAYAYHIIRNHAFTDGNKRTGMASALTFLDWNGVNIDVPHEWVAELGVSIANQIVTKGRVADTFHGWAR